MSFIDNTYFINDINIPVNVYQQADIDQYIERYEDKILQKLLGFALWKALIDDLDNGNPQSERFIDLVDGVEFSFNYINSTINTKWEGLRNTKLKSLIAYWVYFQYRNENESFFSGIGQRKGKGENSESSDVMPKLVYSWNKMIELYGDTPKCYEPYNQTAYNHRVTNRYFKIYLDKEWFLNQLNYEHYNILPSAYNFLLANINNYPEWVFEPIKKLNIFGV